MEEKLIALFSGKFGTAPSEVVALPGSASHRKYYRLVSGDISAIGAVGTDEAENAAFFAVARAMREGGVRVPEVYGADGLCYLQEDLGDTTLFDVACKGGEFTPHQRELLLKTVSILPRIQFETARHLDFNVCYPQREFDARMVDFDLNYFKYCFLKTVGAEFNEVLLQDDFDRLRTVLLGESQDAFMYRDFQARNVMLVGDVPAFIDFQGGRRGPVWYDLASFVLQAKAGYPEDLREALIAAYLKALRPYMDISREEFDRKFSLFALFRTLQVLGCYGFRGLVEKKQYFIDSIAPALRNLRSLLPLPQFPYLSSVLEGICESGTESDGRLAPAGMAALGRVRGRGPLERSDSGKDRSEGSYRTGAKCPSGGGGLTVTITSFSYRKGIPEDESGNGGGYVFDCRGVHNPGKYEEFKSLTGLDGPVIDFLEKDGEITDFLGNIYPIVDAHVKRFLERGFTSLQVSFGCTGGQHRSAYCAEHLAMHLAEKFPVRILLRHRELGIEREMGKKALVLAAGLGTRLRPLTDSMPKALVPWKGRPLIASVLDKLASAGYTDITVNVHHFADMLVRWLRENPLAGTRISISDESEALLDTGGAIAFAAPYIDDGRPVLVHNVDIISDLDLSWLEREADPSAAATLVVSRRETSRYLLFDRDGNLAGWTNVRTGEVRSPYTGSSDCGRSFDPAACEALAFSGIHLVAPALFPLLEQYAKTHGPAFSIIDFYLSVCDRVHIRSAVPSALSLEDVGKIEKYLAG